MRSTPSVRFQLLKEQGADFLLAVKANQRTQYRQIASQFQGKRKIPFMATDQEDSHGRDITWTLRTKEAPQHIRESWVGTSWIVEVVVSGTREGKLFYATHFCCVATRTYRCDTSLRTTPQKLCRKWCVTGGALRAGTGFVT